MAAGALVRCDCEEQPQFTPAALYEPNAEPGDVLDFGRVSVTSQKTLDIVVTSNGSAGLVVSEATVDAPDDARFIVHELFEELGNLGGGETSSITVTYRPCPEAWTGNQLIEDFDFSVCPTTLDTADLNIIDNTPEQGTIITLSGEPAQAPVIEVVCAPAAMQQCGDSSIDLSSFTSCITLGFGDVTLGTTPCDLVFEIRNKQRAGNATGDLTVERMEVLVKKVGEMAVENGADQGFSIHRMDGSEVTIDPDNPLRVPIPVGQTQGVLRLMGRFDGSGNGRWNGQARENTGLRIFNDDPDNRPVVTVSLSGNGAAPFINAQPTVLNFGSVPQGTTEMRTITVRNDGDSELQVNDISFTNPQPFSFTTSVGQTSGFTIMPFGGSVDVIVSYSPTDTGQHADTLRIGSNDIRRNPLEVTVAGGATPRIELDPSDQLVFPVPNPPDPNAPPRTDNVIIRNVGFGDLNITQLEIIGPNDDPNHSSVDDFSIGLAECATLPCNPNITLCSPSAPACSNFEATIPITYDNNDNSTVDLAELRVASNDPLNPIAKVVLSASDVPCLLPTAVITLVTNGPRVGMPVIVDASSSQGGGAPGMPAALVDYEWTWNFTPGVAPVITDNGVQATFTPEEDGVHVLELAVTNDCGAKSRKATDPVLVGP